MPLTWAQRHHMFGSSNLVGRDTHDAAVGPHSLDSQLPGAWLRTLVKI